MLRHPSILIVALIILCGTFEARALEILHSQPRKMGTTAFTRLGEFFGFYESDPTRVAAFTDPKVHKGLFFEVELDTPIGKLPEGYSAKLELITQNDKTPTEYMLKIPYTKSRAKALYLGITEAPFIDKTNIRIFAWRVSVMDKEGKTVASSFSPLWQY